MRTYNGEEFSALIKDGLWIVDFSATWCGPCQMLEPNLEELSKSQNVLKIDVDEYKELAIRYGVMSIPTIIIFKNGNNIKESIGYKTIDELNELIKES